MKAWLRSPAMSFLAIGMLLFALQALLRDRGDRDADQRIEVTATEIGWLADSWTRLWNRPPTGDELRALVDEIDRQ